MNWRLGFGRLARVTAVGYWLVAAPFIVDEFRDAPGRVVVIPADHPANDYRRELTDDEVVSYALFADPVETRFDLGNALWNAGRAFAIWLGVFLMLAAVFRAIRWVAGGFMEKPGVPAA